jgi:hypothetical protein
MPASVAARYCTPIKLWAQQIQSRRPEFSKLQIRGAVMHKLIRIVFGLLKHRSPFDPTLDSTFFPVCQQRPYLPRIRMRAARSSSNGRPLTETVPKVPYLRAILTGPLFSRKSTQVSTIFIGCRGRLERAA